MEELRCEHCSGPGAERGWLSDAHVDVIECIEALRNDIRALRGEVVALKEHVRFLESRDMEDHVREHVPSHVHEHVHEQLRAA